MPLGGGASRGQREASAIDDRVGSLTANWQGAGMRVGRDTAQKWLKSMGLAWKLGSSIADYALSSGANFAASVLLARFIPVGDYGGFAVSFSAVLLASGIHNALVIEPLSVLGASESERGALGDYLRAATSLHWIISLALGVCVFGVGIVALLWSSPLSSPLACASVALLGVTYLWYVRRVYYVLGRPGLASAASAIYAASLLASVAALAIADRLGPSQALLSIGIAAAIAAEVGGRLGSLNLPPPGRLVDGLDVLRATGRRSWEYGRWLLASTVLFWLGPYGYVPLVGLFGGLEGAAALKALQNLLVPLQQGSTAVGSYFLPRIAVASARKGPVEVQRYLLKWGVVPIVAAGLYGAGVILLGPKLIRALYGEGVYDGYEWMLPFLATIGVLEMVSLVVGIGARAIEKPRYVLLSFAASAGTTLLVGLPALERSGLAGALVSMTAASFAGAVAAVVLFVSKQTAVRT